MRVNRLNDVFLGLDDVLISLHRVTVPCWIRQDR